MKKTYLLSSLILLLSCSFSQAQLKPGFDPEEYKDILEIFVAKSDKPEIKGDIANPKELQLAYESPVVGLENKWFLWLNPEKKLALFSIRGTVPNPRSWLANFYSGMIPAKGELKISDTNTFSYNFTEDPKAAVHVGWTLSLGALSESMELKMDELIDAGYADFIITGHSQGGAIAYLATAHFYSLKKSGRWPEDIRIKTYASAAPKPGNLFFALQYEHMTSGGWSYTIVNAADWVPQSPFSVQNITDFTTLNPFEDASSFIKKQKFLERLVFNKVYNKLNKPTRKSQKNFEKYLGKAVGKEVQKQLPGHEIPEFVPTNHYVRTGNQIVLLPDEDYKKKYVDDPDKIFMHHMILPYYDLFKKKFLNQE